MWATCVCYLASNSSRTVRGERTSTLGWRRRVRHVGGVEQGACEAVLSRSVERAEIGGGGQVSVAKPRAGGSKFDGRKDGTRSLPSDCGAIPARIFRIEIRSTRHGVRERQGRGVVDHFGHAHRGVQRDCSDEQKGV